MLSLPYHILIPSNPVSDKDEVLFLFLSSCVSLSNLWSLSDLRSSSLKWNGAWDKFVWHCRKIVNLHLYFLSCCFECFYTFSICIWKTNWCLTSAVEWCCSKQNLFLLPSMCPPMLISTLPHHSCLACSFGASWYFEESAILDSVS